MELRLVPDGDPVAVEAARVAAEVSGVGLGSRPGRAARWWQAGVAESIASRSVTPLRGAGYDVAPSPRSTRGATRA